MKSREVLASFVSYCMKHPEERFWQALRNWSRYNFIYASNKLPIDLPYGIVDTFYWEGQSS